jgi:DNA invertase Pin-like site-specific DNA recombinase
MSLSNLSSAQLAHLISLVKEKEILQAKLEKVNAALQALESGKSAPKKRGRKPGRPPGSTAKVKAGKRGKRLKAPLLKALSAAGSSGITVKELAAKLKVKPGNIFSWFYTTGKKISGIKKIGEAKYAYAG